MSTICALVEDTFLDDIQRINDLGQGNYGKVILVEKPDGRRYAIKYMSTNSECSNLGLDKSSMYDIDALVRLKGVNEIVELMGICYAPTYIALIMEPMDMNLTEFINNTNYNDRRVLFHGLYNAMTRALTYMHSLNIIHFDIKPQNILVKNGNQFKLTDFGLAKMTFPPYLVTTDEVYTLWYRPPEFMVDRNRHTYDLQKGDIWAMGLTFLEFIQGDPIFTGSTVPEMLQLIYQCQSTHLRYDIWINRLEDGTIMGEIPTAAPINSMLSLNPNSRPSALSLISQKISPGSVRSIVPECYGRRIEPTYILLIMKISQRLRLSNVSLIIAIEIFTRYSNYVADLNNVLLLAAIKIAATYSESQVINSSKIIGMYHAINGISSINVTDLSIAEKEILTKIGFRIYNSNLKPIIEQLYLTDIDFSLLYESLNLWISQCV